MAKMNNLKAQISALATTPEGQRSPKMLEVLQTMEAEIEALKAKPQKAKK